MQECDESKDDEIVRMIGDFSAGLDSFAEAVSGSTTASSSSEPFPFSRRLVMRGGAPLDKERLCELATIYSEDAAIAEYLLAALNDDPSIRKDPQRRLALHRCAVREMIEEDSDVFAESLHLIAPRVEPHETTSLLEEIYAAGIRAPNEAELALLSVATEMEQAEVKDFFDWKRAKLYHSEMASVIIGGTSRMAKYLRKQRYHLERQREAKKKDLHLN